jgi:hypothetical protein
MWKTFSFFEHTNSTVHRVLVINVRTSLELCGRLTNSKWMIIVHGVSSSSCLNEEWTYVSNILMLWHYNDTRSMMRYEYCQENVWYKTLERTIKELIVIVFVLETICLYFYNAIEIFLRLSRGSGQCSQRWMNLVWLVCPISY